MTVADDLRAEIAEEKRKKRREYNNRYYSKPGNKEKLAAYHKKYLKKHPRVKPKQTQEARDKNNELQRNRINSKRQKLINQLGDKCSDCHKSFPSCAYDFHHVNPKDKSHPIRFSQSWDKILKEAKKCVLLCACCHRIRHEIERNGAKS